MNIKDLVPYLDKNSLSQCLGSEAFIVPFNIYNRIFPSRTTFRSGDLDLIKRVAQSGHQVTIPNLTKTSSKEVILRKGIDLSDPLVLFIVSIPFNFLISIITNLTVYLLTKGKYASVLVIKLTKQGEVEVCYDEKGNVVANDKAQKIISEIGTAPLYTQPRPYPERPVPIHLEHTSKVVGWGELVNDENGLIMKNIKIEDDTALQLIKSGKLVGFSIGGIAKKYDCSICQKDYITCEHIKGQTYDGKEAFCVIKDVDLAEISIVSDPANVDCRIPDE